MPSTLSVKSLLVMGGSHELIRVAALLGKWVIGRDNLDQIHDTLK